jgi:hypothetical protein
VTFRHHLAQVRANLCAFSKLSLVVKIVLDLRYRWLMTWNSAAAPSPGSGRWPSSSITRRRGPAKNRMQVFQRPSRAALWQRAAGSAAVVR